LSDKKYGGAIRKPPNPSRILPSKRRCARVTQISTPPWLRRISIRLRPWPAFFRFRHSRRENRQRPHFSQTRPNRGAAPSLTEMKTAIVRLEAGVPPSPDCVPLRQFSKQGIEHGARIPKWAPDTTPAVLTLNGSNFSAARAKPAVNSRLEIPASTKLLRPYRVASRSKRSTAQRAQAALTVFHSCQRGASFLYSVSRVSSRS